MRFSLKQLQYFVATGDAGGVTLAAEQLHVSQSTMSSAIAELERRLGVQLFVRRHAQGLSLTPAGQRFLRQAKELLQQAAELERSALELSTDVTGPLPIGCLVTLAPMVTPSLGHAFTAANPLVDLRIVEAGQDRLLDGLRQGALSLALTYDLQLEDDIAFEPLVELPPLVLLGAEHPLAARRSLPLEALAGEGLILLDLPLSREYFLGLFMSHGLDPVIHQRSANMDVIRTLVANGYGYTLINARPRLGAALDGRELVTLPLDGRHRPCVLGIAGLRLARETRAAAAFREHCRAAITARSIPGMVAPEARIG